MASYPALVEWDENAGAYGAVFPDLDIGAVGKTFDEVLANAEAMLQDYVMEMDKRGWPFAAPSSLGSVEVPQGNRLIAVPLTRPSTVGA